MVYSGAWSNHSAQDLQPSYCTETSVQNDEQVCVTLVHLSVHPLSVCLQSAVVLSGPELDLTAPYNHGASLRVRGRVRDTKSPMTKPALLRYVCGTVFSAKCCIQACIIHREGTV